MISSLREKGLWAVKPIDMIVYSDLLLSALEREKGTHADESHRRRLRNRSDVGEGVADADFVDDHVRVEDELESADALVNTIIGTRQSGAGGQHIKGGVDVSVHLTGINVDFEDIEAGTARACDRTSGEETAAFEVRQLDVRTAAAVELGLDARAVLERSVLGK